ncbi:hypothetical protein DPMN_023734 [Dreissena polymorpha]|uniref:Uncharacterized protein n=1 Tax=Dreissena polymorpha TaxID=45954 RepID=A0A9D4LL91_DREPO|nr:hypothetical protein DPMN_023734 [Dreissena polymorpha]
MKLKKYVTSRFLSSPDPVSIQRSADNGANIASTRNLLRRTITMFHKAWSINVTSRFHKDWTINVTSRVTNYPPPGDHVFQQTGTILNSSRIRKYVLSKFHEE